MTSSSEKFKINPEITRELKNKTVLITGGSGSVGTELAKKILRYPIRQIRILDINEHSLFKLNHTLNDSRVRVLLGNILDKDRAEMACRDVDIIFHTAAVKNIEVIEVEGIRVVVRDIKNSTDKIWQDIVVTVTVIAFS